MKNVTILAAIVLAGAAAVALPAAASTAVYSDHTSFAAQLATSVTDTYENPGYVFFQNDAQMSAVLGETTYTTTGFPGLDFVIPVGADHFYCSGCNGSFQLGFADTSVSSGGGVHGVGFDLFANLNFNAMVKFADGTSGTYTLPTSPFTGIFAFWGITSDAGIASIHFAHDGVAATDGGMGIDNLQIGSAPTPPGGGGGAVPEPSAWALMLLGFGGLGGALRRSRRMLASGRAG
jgi:hypothetical protein